MNYKSHTHNDAKGWTLDVFVTNRDDDENNPSSDDGGGFIVNETPTCR